MSVRTLRPSHFYLSLLVAGAALIAGATLADAAASAPRARAATAVRALDVGRERLHVPADWAVNVASKICNAHGVCRRPCGPGYDKRVYLSQVAPMLDCSLNFHRNAVWVVLRSSRGVTTRTTSTFDGQTVILAIPSRGVTFYGFGRQGAKAVNQLESSTLSRLLATHLPSAVPSAWRRVSDGAVSVSVPPAWEVTTLRGNVVNPGSCERPYFARRPAAFVGFGTATVYCTAVIPSSEADAMVAPRNGVWLAGDHAVPFNVLFRPPGSSTHARTINGLNVSIDVPGSPNGTDAVLVRVVVSGRAHFLVLGLGLTPGIAEAILSSLHAG